MAVFFSAKVVGVGAAACAATNPIQLLPYRFSSQEQCDGFLAAAKESGAALHVGMAYNEMQAMVELWKAGQSPKRQPGSPLPLKPLYPKADREREKVGAVKAEAARRIEDRELARLEGVPGISPILVDHWLYRHEEPEPEGDHAEAAVINMMARQMIEDHEPEDAVDYHVPVRTPSNLRGAAEFAKCEVPRALENSLNPAEARFVRGVDDEDFA